MQTVLAVDIFLQCINCKGPLCCCISSMRQSWYTMQSVTICCMPATSLHDSFVPRAALHTGCNMIRLIHVCTRYCSAVYVSDAVCSLLQQRVTVSHGSRLSKPSHLSQWETGCIGFADRPLLLPLLPWTAHSVQKSHRVRALSQCPCELPYTTRPVQHTHTHHATVKPQLISSASQFCKKLLKQLLQRLLELLGCLPGCIVYCSVPCGCVNADLNMQVVEVIW